ncbi:androgen-induced gene 1 protein isoform X1 [Bombyx mori]|uniref:Androgen-induced gene 1 protein-like n=1 Tax=Bombyx mori TaxID=7091 RepID=A0A8R1WJ85_BOMMO|nr:androgen-induced gene 1 protein-like isoform X1 [Bombyx mori]
MLLYHLSVVLFNSYVIWYDQQYVEIPLPDGIKNMSFKARGIFLTFWCFALQTIYFGTAVLNDIIGTNATAPKNPPLIRRVKDIVFSSAFTLALYVFATFWGLYLIDEDLILPAHIQEVLPNWINHGMHTTIVPFIILELLLTNRNYPTRKVGLSVTLLINFTYVFWIHYLYFTQGTWVYPFLDLMNWSTRILFCCTSSIIGVLFYILGENIHYIVTPKKKLSVNGSKRD